MLDSVEEIHEKHNAVKEIEKTIAKNFSLPNIND
jgi:hypothetical protein